MEMHGATVKVVITECESYCSFIIYRVLNSLKIKGGKERQKMKEEGVQGGAEE
jgi:hypothetical protein